MGSDILCFHGIGLLSGWVNYHLFTHIPHQHLVEYNNRHSLWAQDIANRGRHQHGGCIHTEATLFQMGPLRNLMKTVVSHVLTWPTNLPTLLKISNLPTTLMTSTGYSLGPLQGSVDQPLDYLHQFHLGPVFRQGIT